MMKPGAFASFMALFDESLFVSLVAYADETGTHDATGIQPGAEVAGVVGYLGWKEGWIEFERQWQGVLGDYHVDVFHLSEFMNEENGPNDPNWPYLDWSREKRDQFIRDLIPIARANSLFGVGGFVSVPDYHRIVPDWLRAEVKHPYHFCFQLFLESLLKTVRSGMDVPFPHDEQIAFFFDRQPEFQMVADRVFDEFQALRDPEKRMGTMTWGNKAKLIPLQAADLLAGRQRKVLTRKLAGKPPVNEGSWDDDLEAEHNLVMSYADADALKIIVDNVVRGRRAEWA